MKANITIDANFTIGQGELDAVENIAARMTKESACEAEEATFQAVFSTDKKMLTLKATFNSEDALRQLLLRIGPFLTELHGPAQPAGVTYVGEAPQLLKDALKPFQSTFLAV